MNIKEIRSDVIYKEIVQALSEDRLEIFCNKLLQPFEAKYKCIGAPLKAENPGGYDAVSVTVSAGGYTPSNIDWRVNKYVELISRDSFWKSCTDSIRSVLEGFTSHNIEVPVKDYKYTILLNDPANPVLTFTGKTCGDGGIPGYIIGTIIPDEEALEAMPAVLAHETNHNVRWQFMKWSNGITLADMIVSEGLAENQTAYLYGDDNMKARGGMPLGVPYCAGYACGYELIKYYLNKTGKSIYEASVMPTSEIIRESEDFWK